MIKRSVDPGRSQRWLTVKNMSGEEIPAFAAMEPYSVDRDGSVLVRKPTVDDSNRVLINSGAVIGIGDYGVGTNHMATWAYYNTGDGTPATGESIGTQSGQWKLYRGYEGFLVWGGATEMALGIVKVQRDVTCRNLTAGGYYYGQDGIGCMNCCGWCRPAAGETHASVDCGSPPATLDVTIVVDCVGTFTFTLDLVTTVSGSHCGTLFGIQWFGESGDTVSGSCISCVDPDGFVTWPIGTKTYSLALFCDTYNLFGSIINTWYCEGTVYSGTGNAFFGGLLSIPFPQGVLDGSNGLTCSPLHFYHAGTLPCVDNVGAEGWAYTQCDNCVGSNYTVEITE